MPSELRPWPHGRWLPTRTSAVASSNALERQERRMQPNRLDLHAVGLRRRAQRCRDLALKAVSPGIYDELMVLAQEYDAEATEIENASLLKRTAE